MVCERTCTTRAPLGSASMPKASRQLITPQLLKELPKRNVDLRDSEISGFLIRCRASGIASYVVNPSRGRWLTIGRVDRMTLAEARTAARALIGSIESQALRLRSEDVSLTISEAR